MTQSAIVLFAHGARDPAWAEPFKKIQQKLMQRKPKARIELAFLEIMSPTLEEIMVQFDQDEITEVLLIPLFMAQGGHLRHDLQAILKQIRCRYPAIKINLASAIGEVDEILDVMVNWICRLCANGTEFHQ